MSVNVCQCVHGCPQWMPPTPPSLPGLATCIVPLYLSEVAPLSLRGVMGVVFPMGMCMGVVLSQILGLDSILGECSSVCYHQHYLSSLTWTGLERHVWKAHHTPFSSQPRMWGGEGRLALWNIGEKCRLSWYILSRCSQLIICISTQNVRWWRLEVWLSET